MTTHRLHPLDQIVMSLIDCVILYIIGFPAEGMALALIVKDVNNLFVHSNIVLDYPKPWKYIFVSPNMHRWHHAMEKEAHDKNFCVVFAFVDYVMGTYHVPDNALPKAYGSAHAELDAVEKKTILKELWLPFKVTRNKPTVATAATPINAASAGKPGSTLNNHALPETAACRAPVRPPLPLRAFQRSTPHPEGRAWCAVS